MPRNSQNTLITNPGKYSPPEQINEHKCRKYHKCIVQEHKRRSYKVVPRLKKGQSGDSLDQKIDHAGQKELQRQ